MANKPVKQPKPHVSEIEIMQKVIYFGIIGIAAIISIATTYYLLTAKS